MIKTPANKGSMAQEIPYIVLNPSTDAARSLKQKLSQSAVGLKKIREHGHVQFLSQAAFRMAGIRLKA